MMYSARSRSGSDGEAGQGSAHHRHDGGRLCRGCEAFAGLRHERPHFFSGGFSPTWRGSVNWRRLLKRVDLNSGLAINPVMTASFAQVMEEDMILPSWNMLVVDDDRLLCETTVAALNSIGISADWTLDGESAVDMVIKRQPMPVSFTSMWMRTKLSPLGEGSS